ncbi:MAG: carbohydrate ABC transporter permease [Actinomycetota bacterium]
MTRRLRERAAAYLVVGAFAIFFAFPFYWMLVTAFKRDSDLYNSRNVPLIFNEPPTLDHLDFLFSRTPYLRWLWNTGFVGVTVVAITLALSLPAGYALARLAGRWGGRLGVAIFLVYLVPPTLLFLPLSRIVSALGLKDSLWSLVLVYPSFTVPFATWLLMGFFKAIPQEIEEAALTDGCSRLQAMRRVVFPVSLPGILTVVIFSLALVFNEFTYALTFITSASEKTVSIGVPTDLIRGDVFFWGPLMAAAVIPSVPIAFLYNAFLDRFISGFTGGAVR